jgi:hypothetical protein
LVRGLNSVDEPERDVLAGVLAVVDDLRFDFFRRFVEDN